MSSTNNNSNNNNNNHSSTSSSSSLAIVFSRYKSPAGSSASDLTCRQCIQCTAWRGFNNTSNTNTNSSSGGGGNENDNGTQQRRLEYYSFVDHPTKLTFLLGLLRREMERSSSSSSLTLHVTSIAKQVPNDVLDTILDTIEKTFTGSNQTITLCYDRIPSLDQQFDFMKQQRHNNSTTKKSVGWVLSSCDNVVRQALHFFWQKEEGYWFQDIEDEDNDEGRNNNNNNSTSSSFVVVPGDTPGCVSYDEAAADCLFVWPPTMATKSANPDEPSTSLYSLYEVTTGSGKRCLSTWLQQPSTCLATITQRQRAIDTLLNQWATTQSLLQQVRQFGSHDILTLATKLDTYKGSEEGSTSAPTGGTNKALESLYRLYLVSSHKLPGLVEALEQLQVDDDNGGGGEGQPSAEPQQQQQQQQQASLLRTIINSCIDSCHNLKRSIELVEAVLDLDKAPREYLILKSYMPELTEISTELEEVEGESEDLLEQMTELWCQISGTDPSAKPVRLEMTSSSGGGSNSNNANKNNSNNNDSGATYQFRLCNSNDSKLLQSQLGNKVTVHRVLKNGVYFSTKSLRQLSNKRMDLMNEYTRHQLQVVKQCMPVAATYATVLFELNDVIGQLDCLLAITNCAAHRNYCKPIITDTNPDDMMEMDTTTTANMEMDTTTNPGSNSNNNNNAGAGTSSERGLILHDARHPCVELQEAVDYIPNDMRLIFGESSFLLVTGPNMGGKSTYLRALGAIVLMAQIGSFVPCSSATLNLCHHILARVGAGDMQDRGISTFFAEMLESSAILNRATNRSLLLIDELGRGTSTFDGYGIARAISEYIVQRKHCLAVFTTHFHELTALESQLKVVRNCHVTAQKKPQGLTFLYTVKPGPCLESFGIQVAEMANVPSAVVQDAKIKAKELENFEYRKRSDNTATGSSNNDNNNEEGESKDNDRAFVEAFCSMPLESILKETAGGSDEMRRAALLKALGA